MEASRCGVGFENSLTVGRGSSSCCSVGKHYGIVVDASFDWKPVESGVTWENSGRLNTMYLLLGLFHLSNWLMPILLLLVELET